jgi:hypothetical protein
LGTEGVVQKEKYSACKACIIGHILFLHKNFKKARSDNSIHLPSELATALSTTELTEDFDTLMRKYLFLEVY